jgi:hypothetical protein
MLDTAKDRNDLIAKIELLEKTLISKDDQISGYRKQLLEATTKIYYVKEHIKSMYEVEEYIPTDITVIADMLDISLTKQYAVEIHVVYRGNIEMPLDAEINDIEDHIEFSFSDRGADDWEVDIFQYDLSIDAEEA